MAGASSRSTWGDRAPAARRWGAFMMVRIAAALFLLCGLVAAQAQQFGSAEFAIKDDEGDPIANHSLTPEQMAKVARLPGLVDVGDAIDDVTLYQFYDLNCPFCREA